MAGKFKSDEPEKQEYRKDKNGHGKCEAWGCTRWGHDYSGKWHCRYHWACHGENIGKQLAHVSMILKNHEAEINWYEFVLQSSFVDYECGVIDCTLPGQEKKRTPLSSAPETMLPEDGEKFSEYRKRITIYINHLLKLDSLPLRPVVRDGKAAASGERVETFNSVSEFLPDFER